MEEKNYCEFCLEHFNTNEKIACRVYTCEEFCCGKCKKDCCKCQKSKVPCHMIFCQECHEGMCFICVTKGKDTYFRKCNCGILFCKNHGRKKCFKCHILDDHGNGMVTRNLSNG